LGLHKGFKNEPRRKNRNQGTKLYANGSENWTKAPTAQTEDTQGRRRCSWYNTYNFSSGGTKKKTTKDRVIRCRKNGRSKTAFDAS